MGLPPFIHEKAYQEFIECYQGFFFDIDGTLGAPIRGTTFREEAFDFAPWSDRVELLVELHKQRKAIGLASNQAGVAQGYLKRENVIAHTRWLARYIGVRIPKVEWVLAFNMPHAKDPLYQTPDLYVYQGVPYERRKPAPGMLFELLDKFRLKPEQCCYVGDMKIDQAAAEAAGLDFYYASREDQERAGLVQNYLEETMVSPNGPTFFDQLIIQP